jgi:hypothetical protein
MLGRTTKEPATALVDAGDVVIYWAAATADVRDGG